jgi:parallel beta-helix repeat protein
MYILIRNIFVLSLMGVLAAGISAGTAFGDVIFVNDDASGANNGSSWDDAYIALDEALDNAAGADDIWVAAGVYQSSDSPASFNLVDEVDVYGGFAGDEDPEDPNFDLADRNFSANKTELDGQGNTAVVWANSLSNAGVLDGFTIYGAWHGVYCSDSDQTVKNCAIFDNTQKGIFCNNSDAVVEDCTIFDNGHDGIYGNVSSNIQVSNCSISGNGEYGLELGAASAVANSIIHHNTLGGLTGPGQGMVMTNDLVYDNTGNGIHFTSPNASDILRNNTIVYNSGVGIKNDNAGGYSPAISNCIVWGNTTSQMEGNCSAIFSCIQGGSPGTGNIAEDPDFVLSDPNEFHLSADSACVDAGASDPNTYEEGELDIDGEARVYNDRIDIGADEYVPYVPVVDKSTDINGDGIVDYRDFALQAAAWQSLQGAGAWNADCDINNDNVVNIDDLQKVAFDWLYITGDLDDDGIINYVDFGIFSGAWDSQDGELNYNPDYDFDGNGSINLDDLLVLVNRWL